MADLFILALLGHLVGDFLLQPKWMALGKSGKKWGADGICTLHVVIYTTAVCAFLDTWNPWVVTLIALPHWIIDRWSLANKWLGLIGGRTFETAKEPFDIAFTSIVYTFTDNGMHFLCLWAVIRFVIL